MRIPTLTIPLVAGTLALTGCGSPDDGSSGILVAAAASLTDAFTDIGEAFAAERPDIAVTFSFAASSTLATQILEGAPADVLAAADTVTMGRLVAAGATRDDPAVFARNRLTIAVAVGNPLGITELDDLADPGPVLVMCAPEAPCGRYATTVFAGAGIEPLPDSLEENPRAVLTKVALGEADVGIVYATDVIAAGDSVDEVAIPDAMNVLADYPIALTADGPNPAGAAAFVEFVRGATGQAILERHGFTTP
ncbi:MAG: hypothetical protein RIR49_753 [Actinomycetota bacterium]